MGLSESPTTMSSVWGGWLSFVGKILSVIWAAKSLIVYHTWTYEDWVQDIKVRECGDDHDP